MLEDIIWVGERMMEWNDAAIRVRYDIGGRKLKANCICLIR